MYIIYICIYLNIYIYIHNIMYIIYIIYKWSYILCYIYIIYLIILYNIYIVYIIYLWYICKLYISDIYIHVTITYTYYMYICNHEDNMPPGYHHSGFVGTHALRHMMHSLSCAQVQELPQSQNGYNGEGTLFWWLYKYYAHLTILS